MPYPIFPDIPDPSNQHREPEKKPPTDHLSFFEKILTLVIAWQYFHFTGKAIAEGKKLPKDWIALRTALLPKPIKGFLGGKEEKKKSSYRVVDLATREPINIP